MTESRSRFWLGFVCGLGVSVLSGVALAMVAGAALYLFMITG